MGKGAHKRWGLGVVGCLSQSWGSQPLWAGTSCGRLSMWPWYTKLFASSFNLSCQILKSISPPPSALYLWYLYVNSEGNGKPLQYSCLKNSLDRGARWAKVQWITKSWTWLSDLAQAQVNKKFLAFGESVAHTLKSKKKKKSCCFPSPHREKTHRHGTHQTPQFQRVSDPLDPRLWTPI